MRFILRILANALAIYLAAWLIPGVDIITSNTAGWKILLICGVILSLINAIIRPILKLISLPLIIITFGLFSFVINVLMVWLLTRFVPQLIITGVIAFILTALVVSVTNAAVNYLTKKEQKKNDHD